MSSKISWLIYINKLLICLVTDKEDKVIPHLKVMTGKEIMNDLLKLLNLVQEHADKEDCKPCEKMLKKVFESS